MDKDILSEDEISELLLGLSGDKRAEVMKLLSINLEKEPKKREKPRTTDWHYKKVKVKHNFVCRFCGGKFQSTTSVDYLSNNGGTPDQDYRHMVNSCHKCPERLHILPKREIILRAVKVAMFPNWKCED